MKILSQLTAAPADAPDKPRKGIRMGHDREVAPGHFIRAQITDDGLFLECNDQRALHQLLIPIDELYALAIKHDSAFTPKTQIVKR